MSESSNTWTDQRVEIFVGNLLRAGALLAVAVVACGGIVFLARHGGEKPHYAPFVGEPADLRTLSGILKGATTLHGRNIIQLGLLLLIATPVARVAFTVFAFALQRDRMYVVIALIVLLVLLFGLLGGHF